MLQKQSISRDQIFYVIVAVGALALIAITISLASDGRITSFASILPGQAAASEITTSARNCSGGWEMKTRQKRVTCKQ